MLKLTVVESFRLKYYQSFFKQYMLNETPHASFVNNGCSNYAFRSGFPKHGTLVTMG